MLQSLKWDVLKGELIVLDVTKGLLSKVSRTRCSFNLCQVSVCSIISLDVYSQSPALELDIISAIVFRCCRPVP